MISVALIDDNPLLREGLSGLLSQLQDVRVVAAMSGANSLLLKETSPQVVLLDLGLRKGNSLRMAQKIKKELPESKIIVMDLLPMYEEIVEWVQAGVSGFVMKDATVEDLAHTIRSVAEGGHVLPPQLTQTLFTEIATEAVARGGPGALDSVRMTPREREVMNLVAKGLSDRAISGRLHIESHAVKSHVRNIMEKLALHTRLQIAADAHTDGTE